MTEAKCHPDKKYLANNNAKFICKVSGVDGNIKQLNILSDEISGIPDNADPIQTDIDIKNKKVPNYNDPDVFNSKLIFINKNNIIDNNCYYTGKFKIEGEVDDKEEMEKKLNNSVNFNIFLTSVDTPASCNISELNDTKVIMDCKTKDSFEKSDIAMESQMISKDNIPLFIIDYAECEEGFSCTVQFYNRPKSYKHSSQILKGTKGFIITFVLVLVFSGIVLIFGIFFFLSCSHKYFGIQAIAESMSREKLNPDEDGSSGRDNQNKKVFCYCQTGTELLNTQK